jgi:hypothetical protein
MYISAKIHIFPFFGFLPISKDRLATFQRKLV